MADRVETVEEVTAPVATAEPAANRQVTKQVSETSIGGSVLAARIVWYIAGVLLVLLAFRFVLTLMGANPSNGFANFIYSISHPFVAPFFGLFGYKLQYGASRFEIFTIMAMAVYAIVAWGIAKLFTLNKPQT
jgi:uncharacterized protein YggT (Ycf19 family)